MELRPLREADLGAYYRWQDEERHWDRYTCRPVEIVRPYTVFADRYLEATRSGRQVVFSILVGGEVVGRLVAFDYNTRNRSAEIGYYLEERSRGQGVGTEALRAFADALLSLPRWNLHKLYATTSADNAPSQAILRKAGFREDGRLREHYLLDGTFHDQVFCSLLRREWAQPER